MAKTANVDLAIIGSGSGNSLITPFWDNKKVVMAERGIGPHQVFGGTCLNVGCIPTKMFVRPAELARNPQEAARLGITQQTISSDWAGIRDRVFGRVDAISFGGQQYREQLENVDLISEQVTLTGPKSFVTASGRHVEADQLVIAAGSRPIIPEVEGMDLPEVHTSESIMRVETMPQRLLIVGGGYIACEFAAIFSGLGSEVIQINRSNGLMNALDAEIAGAFSAEAEKNWTVKYQRTLSGVVRSENQSGVTAKITTASGSSEELHVDAVLIAHGRTPNSDQLGAAAAGIDLHGDGRIVVDEHQRVLVSGQPVDGLYALGDISSAPMLKHVANHEARVVSHNLENPQNLRKSRQEAIPAAVFTHPELAQVGLTEAEAAAEIGAENITVKTQKVGDVAYGWAMEDQHGLFKVIADRRNGQLLGAHAMGYQSSNLLQPIIQAMSFGQDAYTVARGQYWIHPALNEVVENALLGLEVPVTVNAPL